MKNDSIEVKKDARCNGIRQGKKEEATTTPVGQTVEG